MDQALRERREQVLREHFDSASLVNQIGHGALLAPEVI
jgi:hypothetical protein